MSNSGWAKKLQHIPRPVIAIITFLIVLFSMLVPLNIPVPITAETQSYIDYINSLSEGSVVIFGFDSAVWQYVRTGSAAVATLNLLFMRPVRILIWSITPDAAGLYPQFISLVTIPDSKKYGQDYMYYGYLAGTETALQQMASNLLTPKKDFYGNDIATLPVMKGITNWKSVSLIIQNGSDGEKPKLYVRQWSSPYNVPLAILQTPVNVLMNLPFKSSGQINWVIWANVGGAELETYLGYNGWGHGDTDVQNLIHIFTIGMIILGNIGYVFEKRGGSK